MHEKIAGALFSLGLLWAAGIAQGSEFDQGMQPIMTEYLKIQSALAADTTEGVKPAAEAIAKSSKSLDPGKAPEKQAELYKSIPADLAAACGKLEQAKDIAGAREAFKELSKPMAVWVANSEPEKMSVMHCPMAQAVWVQPGTKVANPYYGTSMAGCGMKVGGAD